MGCFFCGESLFFICGKEKSIYKYEDSFGIELYFCIECENNKLYNSICKKCNSKIILPYNKLKNRYVVIPDIDNVDIDKDSFEIVKICKCTKSKNY